ncbi:MAG: spore coat protein U-like protein [Candidatus Azotimanducaceae bacterium]|jgi:spore coat protein U-like protein
MKRILLALFFAIYLPTSALAASDSATMDVSLNNIASVFVSTTPIDFGDVGTAELLPTASGSITVNATIGLPYNIAIDGGLNPKATGACRQMTGEASREYELFDGSQGWGDADFDNTCAAGSNAEVSKAATGTGVDQIHSVDAVAQSGFSIGSMSDTLTVTVYY